MQPPREGTTLAMDVRPSANKRHTNDHDVSLALVRGFSLEGVFTGLLLVGVSV